GFNYRNIIIVGSNKRTERFIRLVKDHSEWGMRILGIIDEDESLVGREQEDVKIIGSFKDMLGILHDNVVDEVVFIVPRSWLDKIGGLLHVCETEGVGVNIAADFFDFKLAKARQSDIGNFPLLIFDTTTDKFWHLFVKRLFDVIVSAALLLILSPLLVIVSLFIKLTSEGPVFFRQERIGLKGRRFPLYKFRSMKVGAEQMLKELLSENEMTGPAFKMKNDPRITPFGRFIRKTSIDELPQLWNVLRGDMSLVGPRPPIPSEVHQYDNWHRRRLSMRPGITCIWQVNGRNQITDFERWVKLDLEYIDNWSLWLDTRIFFKTIPAVLLGAGAK
ncbi:MAG TPA: sugar transferase, partial [Candidatus Omnitrophota bacterium]|nr:sugar transferase [Candidatus Omnitrophota bacterium]